MAKQAGVSGLTRRVVGEEVSWLVNGKALQNGMVVEVPIVGGGRIQAIVGGLPDLPVGSVLLVGGREVRFHIPLYAVPRLVRFPARPSSELSLLAHRSTASGQAEAGTSFFDTIDDPVELIQRLRSALADDRYLLEFAEMILRSAYPAELLARSRVGS